MSEENLSLFIIEACTGCTCCSSDNFYDQTIHKTIESARIARDRMFGDKVIASQFYENGLYRTYEVKVSEVKHYTLESHHIIKIGKHQIILITTEENGLMSDSFYVEDEELVKLIVSQGRMISQFPC